MSLADKFRDWAGRDKAKESFYGGTGTVHHTGYLDVETYQGEVVAVWFRCAVLPYKQTEVSEERARSMKAHQGEDLPNIEGFLLERPELP